MVWFLMVWFGWDLGVIGGCGQCPGTGFQKVGTYVCVCEWTKLYIILLI